MKAITRRGYTFDKESRDFHRVNGDTSMLTDARSIVFRATTHWGGGEYSYFDLDEDRMTIEYNHLAVKRRRTKIVRRDRYHYYNI